jgi:hypothetical protein
MQAAAAAAACRQLAAGWIWSPQLSLLLVLWEQARLVRAQGLAAAAAAALPLPPLLLLLRLGCRV